MDIAEAMTVNCCGQLVDDIRQIVPESEASLASPVTPERCPLCGAPPRYKTIIKDTTMFLNTFVVGASLCCSDCGVVHAQAYGEYALIYPTGEVLPKRNAVHMVVESWNNEVKRWKERLGKSGAAVEVVRCKDCKHMIIEPLGRYCPVWRAHNGMGDEGFCNYGERKDEG